MSAACRSPVLLLVLLLLVWAAPHRVTGQGMRIDRGHAGATGVQQMSQIYQMQLNNASKLIRDWPKKKLSCAKGTAFFCGGNVESTEAITALRIATSPAVYDTRNASHTGGWVLAPTPSEQGSCSSCVGWALAAAAQSAAAAALRVNSNTVPLISVRQLLLCNAPLVDGDCMRGWRLDQAVALLTGRLQQRAACVQGFAADRCLSMPSPDQLTSFVVARDCQLRQQCNAKLPRGSYSYTKLVPLVDMWQMQQHIRSHGASVITLLVLPPGFKQWFDSRQRKTAVYSGPGSDAAEAKGVGGVDVNHAVVLAGYNNIEGYWIIWSSWGDWADGGFARVRFGQLGVGDPQFTYGIVFNPSNPTKPPLPLSADAVLGENCQYQVQRGDYVSKVADALRLPIERLLQQNVDNITDLGAWLTPGQRLQACGASVQSDAPDVSAAPALGVSSETSCVMADTREVRWTLTSATSVPASATPSGKKWQYFYTYGFSQFEAEGVCVQLGGHLVTVDSNRTNQMLYDNFVAGQSFARDGIWIGLRAQQRTTDRRKWSWLSGAKTNYQNWGTGCDGKPPQPDNAEGAQGRCAILAGSGLCNKPPGAWDDYLCHYGNPFVCEFEPSITKKTNEAQIAVRVLKSATAPDGKLWAFFSFYVVQAAAQKYCQQSGGNLVTVDSANKTQFLIEEFLEVVPGLVYGVWIGLFKPAAGGDPTEKSQYQWYSGAAMNAYSNWGRNEPNGDALKLQQIGAETCGHAAPPNHGGSGLSGGSWNDVSCDRDVNPRPFICEFSQS